MSAITLVQAQAKLQVWMDADDALALGQSYQIEISGTRRSLTRADAAMVQERLNYWQRMVNRLARTGSTAPTVRYVEPFDR
jgi:hypothetical protein